MTLNEYQTAARTFAVYPQANKGSLEAIVYCTLGLGEVGELQGKIKKVLRGDGMPPYSDIISELGDVLWYVSQLAEELQCTLAEVAERNLEKLQSRKNRGKIKGSGDYR